MYLLRALIGSYDCLRMLFKVRVITWVLVLRHSNENRSIQRSRQSIALKTTFGVTQSTAVCNAAWLSGKNAGHKIWRSQV